jgi:Co/Zn/Cd efflux system component
MGIFGLAHYTDHKFMWKLDIKRVLLIFLIIDILLITTETIITGKCIMSMGFILSSLMFVGHYLDKGINNFFKKFHIKKIYRSVIVHWTVFGIVLILYFVYFAQIFTDNYLFLYFFFNFIFLLGIIVMLILTINPLIRIFAVGFHRRKYELFPINRVELPAMHYLIKQEQHCMEFSELRNKIRGLFNIFIPKVYFNDQTAASSIYSLCALGLADIKNNLVILNETGQQEEKVWKDTLNKQTEAFDNILNNNSILIKSFLGLFVLSLFKIYFGFFLSQSLFAEGFENLLDCIAIVLIGIGIKYNREKLINIVLVCLMVFAGISILIGAVEAFMYPKPIPNVYIIIVIALISIFLNTYLRALKNFIGKKNRNSSLVASAMDSRVNIIISIGVIIGALSSEFGTSIGMPIFYLIDPIIAIIICILIFKEVLEIIIKFIARKEEEIEFEKFQVYYETYFEEYIIKWILSVLNDNLNSEFSPNQINDFFQESLRKGAEIYTEFAYFGLYLFKENGIKSIIKKLIDDGLLIQMYNDILKITERGEYYYEHFYSKQLLDEVRDPFDFFFEEKGGFDTMEWRKKELVEISNN